LAGAAALTPAEVEMLAATQSVQGDLGTHPIEQNMHDAGCEIIFEHG